MHLGTQVSQQELVLALSLHPAFKYCYVCIDDDAVKQISLPTVPR